MLSLSKHEGPLTLRQAQGEDGNLKAGRKSGLFFFQLAKKKRTSAMPNAKAKA